MIKRQIKIIKSNDKIIRSLLPKDFDEAVVAVILSNALRKAVVTPTYKTYQKTVEHTVC